MIPKNSEQLTILLVDDTPENLKMLISFLEGFDFRIAVVQSGEEALEQVKYALPDLILLDVLMPGMDGFETCRCLKDCEAAKNIPVIFMTALTETVDKVKGFEMGGVDYLTKPVQHEEVLARINAHLTIRRLQQHLQVQNTRLEEQNALLKEQNARFQALSEATFEGILIHDEGRILDVNQTLEKTFGYQRVEVLGKHVLEFIMPEFRQSVSQHIQLKDDTPYEAVGIKRDGSHFPIEIQTRTMPYEGRNVRVASVRDLSWRKTMEEEKAHLQKENITLRSTLKDRYKFCEIIGRSPAMQEVYQHVANASASNAGVLICGESGTGKELVARTIHQMSERKEQTFVAVNCGAVPEPLFEREFFGHRKGAFTGATTDKAGYFDCAHRGTLFLDEVGELTPAMQVKLLRVLQDGEYMPLGDTHTKQVDVRIIAATNKDLKEQLRQGLIREDFFYRIRVVVIHLPPLRERKEDIPLLIEHFLEQYADGKDRPMFPGKIIEKLCAYHWPGNIRELQNELQRYLAQQSLEFDDTFNAQLVIGDEIMSTAFEQRESLLQKAVDEFEKRFIAEVFERNHGNRKDTAEILGIDRKTLYRKLKKYGAI